MTPTAIQVETFVAPDGTKPVVYGPPLGRDDVSPLPTLVTPDGRVASQWLPTRGELELLQLGVPVTLVLHSGGVVCPLQIGVGGFDLR